MIYCVIPPELEVELYEKMVAYYSDNPNVTVILDRREGAERRDGPVDPDVLERRTTRSRRRSRVTGEFPSTDPPADT